MKAVRLKALTDRCIGVPAIPEGRLRKTIKRRCLPKNPIINQREGSIWPTQCGSRASNAAEVGGDLQTFLARHPRSKHHVVINCLYSKCLGWRIGRNCNWSGFGQNFSVCELTSIFVAILLCVLVELGSCGTLDRAYARQERKTRELICSDYVLTFMGSSALGHKRTLRPVRAMSALPPKADTRSI
jgi:hypothetical protein